MADENEEKTVGAQAADQVGEKKADVVDEVATDLAKDAVRAEARMATGNETTDVQTNRWHGSDEMNLYADLLDLGPDALQKAIDPKNDRPVPEEKVAGLLILERNGRNRTNYVKMLMKRLGIKDLRKELPQAGGPDYTNDQTNLTDL